MQVVSPEDTSQSEKCKGDFVKVMDGDCSAFKAETRYCGKQEPAPFFSTGNKLCVKFFSDESQTAQGFSASYEAVDRPTNPGGERGGIGNVTHTRTQRFKGWITLSNGYIAFRD